MDENLKLKVSGKVKITIGEKVYNIDNAIQITALNIIRRCIGVGTPRISIIRLLNGSTTLAQVTIPTSQVSFIGNYGAVKFTALFSESSFEGAFNGLELRVNDPMGTPGGSASDIFSKISGIDPIEKTFDNQMLIEWVLTIELT